MPTEHHFSNLTPIQHDDTLKLSGDSARRSSVPSNAPRFAIRELDATLAHLNENACGVALVVDGSGDVVTIADDPTPIPYMPTVIVGDEVIR